MGVEPTPEMHHLSLGHSRVFKYIRRLVEPDPDIGLPRINLDQIELSRSLIELSSREELLHWQYVPIRIISNEILVAISTSDQELMSEVSSKYSMYKVAFLHAEARAIEILIDKYWPDSRQ
jgi:hypothetical protein